MTKDGIIEILIKAHLAWVWHLHHTRACCTLSASADKHMPRQTRWLRYLRNAIKLTSSNRVTRLLTQVVHPYTTSYHNGGQSLWQADIARLWCNQPKVSTEAGSGLLWLIIPSHPSINASLTVESVYIAYTHTRLMILLGCSSTEGFWVDLLWDVHTSMYMSTNNIHACIHVNMLCGSAGGMLI